MRGTGPATTSSTEKRTEQEHGMSKSPSANNQRRQSKLALALMAGGLVAGCGGGGDPWTIDPEGYDGISEQTFGLLTNSCTINTSTTTMPLSMRDTETLYLT